MSTSFTLDPLKQLHGKTPFPARQQARSTTLRNWILDFLYRQKTVAVRIGNNTSFTVTLNTGAPQGCVLSPLLYSLFTLDCLALLGINSIIKFADDTSRPDN